MPYFNIFQEHLFIPVELSEKEFKKSKSYKDDIFVMDIIREEIENDDLRVQRIIFK